MAAPETSTERAEPILRLRGVGRRFGGVHAVSDVDLDVRPGERRAILGPNGAGKTTLFNLISGEFPPTTGSVELFGTDITGLPARKRARMGLSRTFQTSRLFLGLPVEDNLYLSVLGVHDGHLRLVPSKADAELREKARAMGEAVGLTDRMDSLVMDLSHGEQRQLEVGMARASEPKLMMLDEPAAGLSRAERVKLTELLLTLDPLDHADPDRARHGRRAARGPVGHDDARRPRDRGGHAGRHPRQPDRARPVSRERADPP